MGISYLIFLGEEPWFFPCFPRAAPNRLGPVSGSFGDLPNDGIARFQLQQHKLHLAPNQRPGTNEGKNRVKGKVLVNSIKESFVVQSWHIILDILVELWSIWAG